jgi:hypothetical protein
VEHVQISSIFLATNISIIHVIIQYVILFMDVFIITMMVWIVMIITNAQSTQLAVVVPVEEENRFLATMILCAVFPTALLK